MAEKLLVKKLKEMKINEFSVTSCGVFADGNDMTKETKEVLNQKGFKVKSRKSKKLTKTFQKKSDVLFLTMTKQHKTFITANNVYSIGEFVDGEDVIDPFGFGYNIYLETFNQLDKYTTIIAQKIKKILGD